MATIALQTTRPLTPAELVSAQTVVDESPGGAGVVVVNGPTVDAALNGGTVTVSTDGNLPQEQFDRALALPAVPACAIGDITISGTIDLVIATENVGASPGGFVGVFNAATPGLGGLVTFDGGVGAGTYSLSIGPAVVPRADYDAGLILVTIVEAETGENGIATFQWSNGAFTVEYDSSACPPPAEIPCGDSVSVFTSIPALYPCL